MRQIGNTIDPSPLSSVWKSSMNYRNEVGMELGKDSRGFIESLNSAKTR